METNCEPCWCPFALLRSLKGGEYWFSAFHVVIVKQLWCCQSDFISPSCLFELPFNKLSPFYVGRLFEVKNNNRRLLGFHCSCRDAQFSCVVVTDTLWFCSCRLGARRFLQFRTQPKALALCAAFLSHSSVEQPSALISYFGLCTVFRLFSLQASSWNPSSICLWSFIAHCSQCSHSLSIPGSPNTCSSWWKQTPGPCYFKRWSCFP